MLSHGDLEGKVDVDCSHHVCLVGEEDVDFVVGDIGHESWDAHCHLSGLPVHHLVDASLMVGDDDYHWHGDVVVDCDLVGVEPHGFLVVEEDMITFFFMLFF
jgi:hypothetical protein